LLAKARKILHSLEKDSTFLSASFIGKTELDKVEVDYDKDKVRLSVIDEEIDGLDLWNMTPMNALNKLAQFQNEIRLKRGINKSYVSLPNKNT